MGYPRGTNLSWSPIRRPEVEDLATLLTASEHLDEPSERFSRDALYATVDAAGFDPADLILGRDTGGTLVAYAHNHPNLTDIDPRRVYLSGGVHPGWRRRGIGHAVLTWQLEHARRWYLATRRPGVGPLRVLCHVEEKLTDRVRLLTSVGLQPQRWYADLSLDLRHGAVPTPPEVPGIELVRYTAAHSEPVREAHNHAFADHWGSQPVDRQHWEEQLAWTSFRPDWSWVAVDTASGEVAGYALNSAYEQDWAPQGYQEGWTDRLGVLRHWRGRGVATALLAASARSFAAADVDAAGIGVDTENPSGAFLLYRRLGYVEGDTTVLYGCHERLWQDLGGELPYDPDALARQPGVRPAGPPSPAH